MIRGFYAAVSGMLAHLHRAQIVSNNLANLGTVGYKEDVNIFRDFRTVLLDRMSPEGARRVAGPTGSGAEISPTTLKMDQGALRATGNPLDIALAGPGFFAVQTPDGVSYTRTGHLYRDPAGDLVTSEGFRVLGQTGPINLPQGDYQFDLDGTVRVNGTPVDQLQLVEFPNPQLMRKSGSNRYEADEAPTPATATTVRGGFLEESNVDATRAMVDLIMVQRAYDASQLLTKLQDDVLGRTVNEVGRVTRA